MYYRPDGYKSKKPNMWYASLLIVIIPVFIFTAAFNIVTRLPDVYADRLDKIEESYQNDKESEVLPLSEAGVFIDNEDFAAQIAAYINGKSDRIDTIDEESELYEYYIQKVSYMSQEDYNILKAVRNFDLVTLIISILFFCISLGIFIILLTGGYETKALYRKKFLWSLIGLAVIIVFAYVYAYVSPVAGFINTRILGLEQGQLLKTVFGELIVRDICNYTALIALAITLINCYITWVCTKPRDIFNRRRYFK